MGKADADRGTGQNVCVEGKGHQGFQQPLEAGERHGTHSSSESPEGTYPAKMVESECLASTMVSDCFSVVLSPPTLW